MKCFIFTLTISILYSYKCKSQNENSNSTKLEVVNNIQESEPPSNGFDTIFQEVTTTKNDNKIFILREKNETFSINNIIGAMGLIFSLATIWFAIYAFKRERTKERANKQFESLFDIDKQLIDKPHLWKIYDIYNNDNFIQEKANHSKQWIEGQLEAFCYFHLNNFEFVFAYPPSNKYQKKAWRNYMIHLIVSSTRFRSLLTKESQGYIYSKEYKNNMIKYLETAKKIQPIFDQYARKEIEREVYYAKAIKILDNDNE